ncbi:MAG: winged helix-turn-helix transcriptional regulator [Clostridia bacterium]|nr:winged helix-turn-helix transcriptional regulator [Clostridia bacterium]
MADTQMMRPAHFSVNEISPLLLVTEDESLAHLIALEAHELALPMVTLRELPHEPSSVSGQAVILDLDCFGGMQAALYGQTDAAIGICHRASALPTMLLARVIYLLERPFATLELRTLLGRLRHGEASAMQHTNTKMAETALVMSLEGENAIRCGEHHITLTLKELALMKCLLENRGQVVSREQLRECLRTSDKSEVPHTNKTEVYLCRLRRKLEKPTGRKLITTVRGVGYRLE